jgi:hypothetical protein
MFSYWEVEELAAALLGKTEEYENEELEEDIDSLFYDKFDIQLESLYNLLEKLVPMIESDVSGLTGTRRKGFGQNGCYILKEEY